VSAHSDYAAAICAGHIEQGLLGLGGKVSEGPRTTRVLRGENDLVMTNRHTLLGVAETNPCQQCSGWNGIGLSPRASVVVTQKNLAALAHSDEPLTGHCYIEKQCAGRETRMFGDVPRFSRLRGGRHRQRGNQRESRGRQMPPECYRTPLICSTLGW
jgi:hypothetical protein